MLSEDLAHLAAHLRAAGEGGLDDGLSPGDCDALAARLDVLAGDADAVERVGIALGGMVRAPRRPGFAVFGDCIDLRPLPENVVLFPARGTFLCVGEREDEHA